MTRRSIGLALQRHAGRTGGGGFLAPAAFLVVGLVGLVGVSACSSVPSQYTSQAERGVTLSALKARPEAYQGKVVILGGVLVEEKQAGGRIWLRMKNRPLDGDYVPHMPTSLGDPESGHYWIVLNAPGASPAYRSWARMTVVGRLMDHKSADIASGGEPVLAALYLHGWDSTWGGYGLREATWEAAEDPNYLVSSPLKVKPGQ